MGFRDGVFTYCEARGAHLTTLGVPYLQPIDLRIVPFLFFGGAAQNQLSGARYSVCGVLIKAHQAGNRATERQKETDRVGCLIYKEVTLRGFAAAQ